MKKSTKMFILCIVIAALALSLFAGCGSSAKSNKSIVLWTSGEDYKNEYYLTSLQKHFPQYDFTLEYMSSSTMAAKVTSEGDNCECDIMMSEEYGFLDMCEDQLAELKDFDFSLFLDELVPASHKYTPEVKNGGCVIVNLDVLEKKGLDKPSSYQDLLDPQYEGLISMPSPASSGTGYMFLKQLVNEWGEDEAFEYFEALTKNILQYTSSGSGPINALVQGEAAIGLGMTSQAVVEINQGVNLEILFFDEGSPYSMYGYAVLNKSAQRPEVMEVFNYLATDLCKGDNELYFPDQIFKDFKPSIEGFPTDINYGNMENNTLAEKERLIEKWTFS